MALHGARADASRRRAPPLVLIPGHMATALAWRYQIDAFANDRQTIVPDRHYALSTIPAMAREIAPRLPPRFDLVGWSMGGYIAFQLYPLVRRQVRRLVLISTSARAESEQALARRGELLCAIEAEGLREALTCLVGQGLAEPAQLAADFRESLLAECIRLGEPALRSQIKAMIARGDVRASLGQMQCRALVIAGRRDPIIPVECSEELVSLLPLSELRILETAGHCPPWEEPQEVNRLLRNFLQ